MSYKMSYNTWLRTYLKHPLQLGALFPSGPSLGALMVEHIKPDQHLPILELGAGSGSFTRALLAKGIPEEDLILVEQSQDFANYLETSFPRAKVICGDATNVVEILSQSGIHQCAEIVSGIPLYSIGSALRRIICNEALKLLKLGGSLAQVSYIPRCSIPNDIIIAHSARKTYCGMVLNNIPPAFVWRALKY